MLQKVGSARGGEMYMGGVVGRRGGRRGREGGGGVVVSVASLEVKCCVRVKYFKYVFN